MPRYLCLLLYESKPKQHHWLAYITSPPPLGAELCCCRKYENFHFSCPTLLPWQRAFNDWATFSAYFHSLIWCHVDVIACRWFSALAVHTISFHTKMQSRLSRESCNASVESYQNIRKSFHATFPCSQSSGCLSFPLSFIMTLAFSPPIIIMLAYMWALKDYTRQQQPGWKCLVQRDRNRNSFVIIISTDSLMPHDCLETFSHFVIMLASQRERDPSECFHPWGIARSADWSGWVILSHFSLSSLSLRSVLVNLHVQPTRREPAIWARLKVVRNSLAC